jgi:hypothetical protein
MHCKRNRVVETQLATIPCMHVGYDLNSRKGVLLMVAFETALFCCPFFMADSSFDDLLQTKCTPRNVCREGAIWKLSRREWRSENLKQRFILPGR